MATGIIKLSSLSATADAIRSKIQNERKLYPKNMPNAIASITTIELNPQEATSNERNIIISPDTEHNALNKVIATAATKGLCSYSNNEVVYPYVYEYSPAQLIDGIYYISYDAGDYMQYNNRKVTRIYPSGTPLLIGLSKAYDGGYCVPVIVSAVDLGEVTDVLSGSYLYKSVVNGFSDGSLMYLYAPFLGAYKGASVEIYHNNNLVTTINGANPSVIMPWADPYNKIICSDEELLHEVEKAIKWCGGLK